MKNVRKLFVRAALALGALVALSSASGASADSVSASLGTVVTGADRGCVNMSFGRMQNTCARNVGWEVALPVRVGGTKFVEIAVPDGVAPACYAYRQERSGGGIVVLRTPSSRLEGASRILRFGGLAASTNFTLNAGCELKNKQIIQTISWDA